VVETRSEIMVCALVSGIESELGALFLGVSDVQKRFVRVVLIRPLVLLGKAVHSRALECRPAFL
jgi:hypothetical protein